MELPKITYPPGKFDIEGCCGEPTHIQKIQLEVTFLCNPPRTINRYVTISKWQCNVWKNHNGYDWVTTNWRLDGTDAAPEGRDPSTG